MYSYTLLSNLIPDPPMFKTKSSMYKHMLLNSTEEDLRFGVIIDANGVSYNFSDPVSIKQFLEIEEDEAVR